MKEIKLFGQSFPSSPSSVRSSVAVLAFAVILGAIVPEAAVAERYRVDLAVQVGTIIDGYTITELNVEGGGPYSISDQGEIAFIARLNGAAYDD